MPTSSWNKFQDFAEQLCKGKHDLDTHTIRYALCAAANAPVATNTILSDLTQISYTNLTDDGPGGREVSTAVTESGGTATVAFTDLTITASGGSIAAFRYVVLYNDSTTSPLDALIGWIDYGSDVTLADTESLLLDFAASSITVV